MIMNYLINSLMIKEITYIGFLIGVSHFHTLFIFPVITSYISINIYNSILIFLLVLIQIDNLNLFYDLSKNTNIEINKDVNTENIKIIINQLAYISRKQEEFIYQKHLKYKKNGRMTRSYNDLNNIE